MSKELCPCGMSIECRYVVTRKDGTKFCVQDMNCFASNKWLKEHDSDLLDKVADMVLNLPKKYIDNFDYVACALILNGLEEMRKEVSE